MKHHVSVILCIMMALMHVSASWGQKQEPLADVGSISLAANPTDGSVMQSDSARFAAAEKEAYGRWQKHLYLKTNAVGWAFVIANIAVELDVAPHWSVALPINYSFWNYFTSKRKLRTLSVYPECRYWFDAGNRGWFVGHTWAQHTTMWRSAANTVRKIAEADAPHWAEASRQDGAPPSLQTADGRWSCRQEPECTRCSTTSTTTAPAD